MVRLWDLPSRREIASLKAHRSRIWRIRFSPDGKLLATGGTDGTAKLWDLPSRREIARFEAAGFPWFAPNSKIMAMKTNYNDGIKLWDIAARREVAAISGVLNGGTFSPDGKTLAFDSTGENIKLWDLDSQQEVATLKGHTSFVLSIVFSPDGNTLGTCSADSTVRLWRAASFAETDARVAGAQQHAPR